MGKKKHKKKFTLAAASTEVNSNILGVEPKVYKCGYCDKYEETLDVPWSIYSSWLYLMQEMKKKEWGGVFVVEDLKVVSFRLPKQEVTGSEVEFKEDLVGNGVIHSHHGMGAFHSGQDDKQLRNLYEFSIVMSSTGHEACMRTKLPCGGFGYIDVKLKVTDVPQVDMSSIKEKTYVSAGFGYNTVAQKYWWRHKNGKWDKVDMVTDKIVEDEETLEEWRARIAKEDEEAAAKAESTPTLEEVNQCEIDRQEKWQKELDAATSEPTVTCNRCQEEVTEEELIATSNLCPMCGFNVYSINIV